VHRLSTLHTVSYHYNTPLFNSCQNACPTDEHTCRFITRTITGKMIYQAQSMLPKGVCRPMARNQYIAFTADQ